MKNLFILLMFACGFSSAQNLIDDSEITENATELGRVSISYDLKNPTEFYRLKCQNPAYAQFPGGETAFKEMLFKNMKSYLDTGIYSVNGTFELHLFIGKTGNLQNFQLKPEVPNSNLLFRDIELALRRMDPKWIPANCNGTAVDSKLRQKVTFLTENFDI